MCLMTVNCMAIPIQHTVNLAVPVFHLFSSGNPDFIIYMDELRVDEFGMTFHPIYLSHPRDGVHMC